MQSYDRNGWQGGRRRTRPNAFVMVSGIVVALLIVVLAAIGLVSVLSGDDEATPPTTLPELTTTTTTSAPTTAPPTTVPEPTGTHVVQSGDSLFSIAEQYGVDLSALIAANPQITDPEDIDIGDVVNIPAASGVTPDTSTGDTTGDTSTATSGP